MLGFKMNKKGIYIAPLAMALIVVIVFFFLMTISPSFKQSVIDFLHAIFGSGNASPPPINGS